MRNVTLCQDLLLAQRLVPLQLPALAPVQKAVWRSGQQPVRRLAEWRAQQRAHWRAAQWESQNWPHSACVCR